MITELSTISLQRIRYNYNLSNGDSIPWFYFQEKRGFFGGPPHEDLEVPKLVRSNFSVSSL